MFMDHNGIDPRPEVLALLTNVKAALPELHTLLADVNREWGSEDGIYRFYHQSCKVYYLQGETKKLVAAITALSPTPGKPLNGWFSAIMKDGTGKGFKLEHNERWLEETRPIVEAFFHARYFVEMLVKYGAELDVAPAMLPSGWAAVLYLYGLR